MENKMFRIIVEIMEWVKEKERKKDLQSFQQLCTDPVSTHPPYSLPFMADLVWISPWGSLAGWTPCDLRQQEADWKIRRSLEEWKQGMYVRTYISWLHLHRATSFWREAAADSRIHSFLSLSLSPLLSLPLFLPAHSSNCSYPIAVWIEFPEKKIINV